MINKLTKKEIVSEYENNFTKLNVLAYICDRCNYNCWYCYNKRPRSEKQLDLNILYQYLVFLKETSQKDLEVELIGGEPTLHSQLNDFLNSMLKISTVVIYTNLSDIHQFVNIHNDNLFFDITYHSLNSNEINYDTLSNLDKINTAKIRGINIMFDRDNFENIKIVYSQLKNKYPDVDVDIQKIFLKTQKYDYTNEQESFYLNSMNDDVQKKFCIQTKSQIEYVSHNQIYEIFKQDFRYWMCGAGKDLLYVHYDGSVYPCDGYYNEQHYPMFNINNTFKYPNKQTFCKIKKCPFQDSVKKYKIFI